MATVHLHLQNVPPEASATDIRHFFSNLDIPDGGVQIVGGSKGDAFVTFSNNEDLLNATGYNKKYFMGRQLLLNLVNNEEIERIIDNMKHEIVAQITPMEVLPSQQASQSREPPASWGMMAAPQVPVYTPPVEFSSHSNDHQWQKRQLDLVPPWRTGGDAKRMRLSSQEPDKGIYNSTSTLSADRSSENLQMELEIERRRAQEMKDELNRHKEKIERLKQGFIEGSEVTAPRIDPIVEETQAPQIAGSAVQWLKPQHQLQAEQARYQYQTEGVTAQPAAYGNQGNWYNRGIPNYPRPTPYYEGHRYSGQNEGYNVHSARYPGPSPGNPEKVLSKNQRKKLKKAMKFQGEQSYAGHTGGYNCEDPKLPGPSPNYTDQHPASMNPEQPKQILSKNQRKKLNKARRLDLTSSHPGFVKVSNVDHTVTAKEVRLFFKEYQISPGGLKMKKNDDQDTITVYIEFVQLEDAQKCYTENNKRQLYGREVTIEAISASDFNAQEGTISAKKDTVSAPLQSKMLTQKPAASKGPGPGAQKPLALVKRVCSPYSGSIKQALYFTSLRSVPEDETASSVWEKFGGSTGRSVGVLLLDKKGPTPGREAFVAYENYYERNSEIPDGARDWIDRAVYARFADFSPESKIYKTSSTVEDVELTDDEKALLNQEFLSKSSRKKATHMTDKERESEQPLLNEISRSLFDIKSTEVNEQVNLPDFTEKKSETCTSGPCYLRLDCLPPDITARDVWDWFGAATGPCLRVTLTKLHGMEASRTKVAYVVFRDRNSCTAEMYKYSQSKTMTEKEALDEMVDPGTIVIESTHEVVKRAKEVSSPYSGAIKQALYYTCLRSVPDDATASSVWEKCGGSTGRSVGVLLLDKKGLTPGKEAYVAYENYYDRNSEIARYKGASDWMDRAVYMRFADASPESKMYKATPTGDVELSEDERAMFRKKSLWNSSKTCAAPMTEKERESEQPILNEISRCLFGIRSTEVNQEVSVSDSAENKAETCTPGPCYLRLDCLPPDITAHEVWDWFGASSGPCLRVTLTRLYGKEAPKTKVAYVAYRDHNSCNAEMYKYSQSKTMTEKEVFDEIADTGIRVVESTEELVTNKEKQVDLKSETSVHVLHIKDIGSKLSSAKLWTGWFGGKKGPAQAVTVMDDGRTRSAFVTFRDPVTCKAEKVKHQFSEVIPEAEMLKLFAHCPPNGPPDQSIMTSSAIGDRIMPKRERANLRARFYSAKWPTHGKDEERVKMSELTAVISKEKQTDLKVKCNSEETQADVNYEKEGKQSRHTSEVNIESTPSKREENTHKEDTVEMEADNTGSNEGKGEKSDHTSEQSSPGATLKPEESTDIEDVTKPKPISDIELKFCLQIPNITRKITSSKIWSWFGGPEGSTLRVTVIPKVGNLEGQAFVEFTDAVACDAALSHYQRSKVMTKEEVLCSLADHARRSSKDIFQSSVLGIDQAMTVEERELIISKVYPEGIPQENTGKKDSEGKHKTTSDEEGGDTSPQTSDRKEGNDSTDSKPTEIKLFLQIPNLGEHVTACMVWSWFGGAHGPLPGVTLVQQAPGMKKDAFVAFSDPAARYAVKLQYSGSTDLDEQTMLRTLAEACKSNAEIFQSSLTGTDRLLTSVERELIKNQVFPDTIQSDTLYSEGDYSTRTDQPKHMNKEQRDEEEAQNVDRPRLLQKLDYEYIHLTELNPKVTAFMLRMQYKPCCGVTLIKNELGQSVAAYIAFEPKTNPKANVWQRTRDRELAALGLDHEIYEDTGRLGDRLITLLERQEFSQYVKYISGVVWYRAK